MTRIPFVEARFFEPLNTIEVTRRFEEHLRKLRKAKLSPEEREKEDWERGTDTVTREDHARIRRRVNRIEQNRHRASRFSHLKTDDRQQIEMLSGGVELRRIETEARADEIASALHTEMPWMAPATEHVWHAMRTQVRQGDPGFRLPPMLLVGPPGIGKSTWARRTSAALDVPLRTIDATVEQSSFSVGGVQRGWSSAHAGKPVATIIRHMVANPIVVLDEIEKATSVISSRGERHSLADSLLPLLEPETSRRWECPYYQLRFDMRWVGWILTANSLDGVSEPLLSRLVTINLSELSTPALTAFARQEGRRRGLSENSIEIISEVIEKFADRKSALSLRSVIRMLERADRLENQPMLH